MMASEQMRELVFRESALAFFEKRGCGFKKNVFFLNPARFKLSCVLIDFYFWFCDRGVEGSV